MPVGTAIPGNGRTMILPTRPGASFVLLLAALLGACDASRAHQEEVDAWHAHRIERLIESDGWLSLTGLYWLQPGANTFGRADSNDLVFPDSTLPPYLGSFVLSGDSVTAHLAPGSGIRHTGGEADTIGVVSDAYDEPTIFERSSLKWYVIERDGSLGVRLHDSLSTARKSFAGIDRYPVDPAWRIRGRFVPLEQPRPMEVPTVLNTVSTLTTLGAVEFEVHGETHRLDVAAEPGATRYWIIFADPTNRSETYPAGRYVYIDAPTASGSVEIDFNMSYNPPCAFSPYATCPFPPSQNRLKVPIEAGEKRFEVHG